MARRNTALLGIVIFVMLLSVLFASQAVGLPGSYFRFDLAGFHDTYPTAWSDLNNYGPDHYMAVGNDNMRTAILNAGNDISAYWDNMNSGWDQGYSGSAYADYIYNCVVVNFDQGLPTWIILNEISRSNWDNSTTYRAWVHNLVSRLKDRGLWPIVCSPYTTDPTGTPAQWQAIQSHAYIGTEVNLSGKEVATAHTVNGVYYPAFSTAWCQLHYQNAKDAYNNNLAVFKLFLIENFSETNSSETRYGRGGVSLADWQLAIRRRGQASHNVIFPGYLGYAWGGNPGGYPESDIRGAIDAYNDNSPF